MGPTADATEWWSRMQIPDGVRDVRVADAGQCAWWMVTGYFHSLRVSAGWRRASAAALAFLTVAMYPLVVGCYAPLPLLRQRQGWRTDHAVLYVVARRNHWVLDTHLSSCPGAGQVRIDGCGRLAHSLSLQGFVNLCCPLNERSFHRLQVVS